MPLEVIIGLEIHAQIATKTKMFCSCDNEAFGAEPNSRVCPICTGQPGTLPVPNKKAIELGVKTALALGCEIPEHSKFDRKNYFYPDLPYGYQISQFDEPISKNGAIEIVVNGEKKRIGITRLHLENDAGKLTHTGDFSLCDYNRAGTPLMEIVSEPDLRSAQEARLYAEEIQKLLQYVGSSNADMYRGEMRFDASVSLREIGTKKLNARAEIKNLNSFKAVEAAILYEVGRQTKLWEAGTPPSRDTTVGWSDEKGETYLMREKESSADYRYFPEPDIPPLEIKTAQVESWKKDLPELPLAKRARFVQAYDVSEEDALTLTSSRDLANYYEEVANLSNQPKKSANWLLSEVFGRLNNITTEDGIGLTTEDGELIVTENTGEEISNLKFSPRHLAELIKMIEEKIISGKQAKEILDIMMEGKEIDPREIVESHGMKQISDPAAIEKIVDEIITANPKQVEQYRSGKEQLFGFFVGQAMKATGGQASPALVNELLKKKLTE